jgi:general secretion pathway protein G
MNLIRIRKRFITLIEIMIVMFLIALITGVIAYNYRGSLDEGKAFKTKVGIEKVRTILNLKAAEDSSFAEEVQSRWKDVIRNSPMVQNPDALIKDGWGEEYQVNEENGTIYVNSRKYEDYINTHRESMFKK